MKNDQNLKCRQKLLESFNAFAMSDIESSKEGNGHKRLSGDENKCLNGRVDR